MCIMLPFHCFTIWYQHFPTSQKVGLKTISTNLLILHGNRPLFNNSATSEFCYSFIHPSFCIVMTKEARTHILKAEPGPVSVSLRVYLQNRVQEMEFTILKISNIQKLWRARSFCLTCKLICVKMRLLNSMQMGKVCVWETRILKHE